MKIKSGGGITSNKLVQAKGYKTEPKPHAVNPVSVSTLGVATQFKKPPLVQGKGCSTAPMPATGGPGVYNAAKQGPGSLRTVYKSGLQSHYGSNPPNAVNRAPDPPATTPGKDILSMYGPERK
jgi:hypothetical protein